MGKFDLNPDELKKFDLTPEENAPKSKYPGPKMVTDEEAGLKTSPIRSVRLPGTALSLPARQDMSDLEFDTHAARVAEDTGMLEGALGDATLGKLIGSVLPAGGKQAAASAAPNALSSFAKGKGTSDIVAGALKHMASKVIGDEAAQAAARALGYSGPAISKAYAVAKGITPAAGVAAGEAVRQIEAPPEEPKKFKGVMSNAIDRLRVAAQTDARARELLSRIDAPNEGAGTGEVTQSTLGAP